MDFQRAQQSIRLDRLEGERAELEGKAVSDADRVELLSVWLDQIDARLDLLAEDGPQLDGKAVAGMSRWDEECFCHLIEALGGGPADGCGKLGREALNADERSFNSAAELIHHQREPEDEREARALALFEGATTWTP